ncbi:NADP-dependent isocitrate dehydrogenase, partial [bacterium]|nr:NADP-dependent isocitrate dehydrogenase [bacterium]
EQVAGSVNNARVAILDETMVKAIAPYLEQERFPSRKVHAIDNRGCRFYLAPYWAQALAAQDKDAELKARFEVIAADLISKEEIITGELLAAQGQQVDIGGYFHPDDAKAEAAMRPSASFNAVIDGM